MKLEACDPEKIHLTVKECPRCHCLDIKIPYDPAKNISCKICGLEFVFEIIIVNKEEHHYLIPLFPMIRMKCLSCNGLMIYWGRYNNQNCVNIWCGSPTFVQIQHANGKFEITGYTFNGSKTPMVDKKKEAYKLHYITRAWK